MTIRITGMNSGLDTEAIINELASARSVKVQKIEKNQTKLSWKIDAWKELNKKIYSLYSDVVSDMRFDYAYAKKTTKVSDPDAVTVITAGDAMNGVQSLEVEKMAKTGYLTGKQLGTSSGEKLVANLDGLDWLKDETKSVTFKVTVGGEEKEVKLSGYDTLNGVAEKFKEIGLDARYDEKSHRFFIASKETGEAANFTIEPAQQKELGVPAGLQKVNDILPLPKTWESMTQTERDNWTASLPGFSPAQAENAYNENRNKIDADNNARESIIEANNAVINSDPALSKKLGLQEVPKAWADLTDDEKTALDAGVDEAAYTAEREKIIAANNNILQNEENIKRSNLQSAQNFADIMNGLGLLTEKMADKAEEYGASIRPGTEFANKIEGQDAVIKLNGATFTSSTNTFEMNGLTLTIHKEAKDPITLTTEQDTSGIYDTIKNFIKKYSELINEMDKLYNAESASKYEPLTKEEKEALSDTEVEEWEKKIKESLLRRDTTLSSVSSALKTVMLQTSIPGKDGKNITLSYFGIETLGYFKAKDNEKSAYHINGDPDDADVKNYEDKLKTAIATEPDTVIKFFKELANNLYDTLEDKMAKTDYSSSFTVYNDKQMALELKEYDSKIKKEQDKLNDYIDRWYDKFSQMEVALSKLNSKESSLSSLFG